jgi:hypothetical protein
MKMTAVFELETLCVLCDVGNKFDILLRRNWWLKEMKYDKTIVPLHHVASCLVCSLNGLEYWIVWPTVWRIHAHGLGYFRFSDWINDLGGSTFILKHNSKYEENKCKNFTFFDSCIVTHTHVCNKNQQNARFFINDWIQSNCFRHVSNSQVFILRQACACSFMVFYAEIIIKSYRAFHYSFSTQ